MKTLLIIMLVAALASCGFTTKGNIIRSAVVARGTEVADQSLENTIYLLCNVATIGSINRWIGGDVKKAAHYFGICHPEVKRALIGGLTDGDS